MPDNIAQCKLLQSSGRVRSPGWGRSLLVELGHSWLLFHPHMLLCWCFLLCVVLLIKPQPLAKVQCATSLRGVRNMSTFVKGPPWLCWTPAPYAPCTMLGPCSAGWHALNNKPALPAKTALYFLEHMWEGRGFPLVYYTPMSSPFPPPYANPPPQLAVLAVGGLPIFQQQNRLAWQYLTQLACERGEKGAASCILAPPSTPFTPAQGFAWQYHTQLACKGG